MYKSFLSAIIFLIFTVARAAAAECPEEAYKTVGHKFRLEDFQPMKDGGVIVSEVCKAWPGKPELFLVAFAYDQGVEYEKNLIVAVLNKQNMRLLSWYRNKILEDAITEAGEESLILDTAKYDLSKTVKAFGLRFKSTAQGPSCADGASWDELTLFIQDKSKLRPIFKKEMQHQNALQGCIGSATGQDVWEYGVSTISIMTTRSNGFSDLLLVDTVTVDTNMDNPPANISFKKRTSTKLFQYDGIKYEQAK